MRQLLLVLIATAGCARQAQTRIGEPRSFAPQRSIELRQLCTNAEYQSMCTPSVGTPSVDATPVLIDTNLATPAAGFAPALG
jgi:hypothetical protein